MYCKRISFSVVQLLFIWLSGGRTTDALEIFEGGLIKNCAFGDTVEIDDNNRLTNGSYVHENVVIPSELVGDYNFHEYRVGEQHPMPFHKRACICKLKSCVKLCCQHGQSRNENSWTCNSSDKENAVNPLLKITLNNGKKVLTSLDGFIVQNDHPSYIMHTLLPHQNINDEWELFENGTLWLPKLGVSVPKADYCLNPLNSKNDEHIFVPLVTREYLPGLIFWLKNICMAISVPLLLGAIAMFLSVAKVRTLHTKYFIYYLIALAMAYTTLVTLNLHPTISDMPCKVLGYWTYFSFMSAFAWLSVLSYDLWITKALLKQPPFYLYTIATWGFAALLTCLAIWAQYFADIDDVWRPGVGSADFCWLPTSGISSMVYFYGPMFVLMMFNVIACLLWYTTAKYREKQYKSKRTIGGLLLLLSLLWSLEVQSALVGNKSPYTNYFLLGDFLNALQGLIIFIITLAAALQQTKPKRSELESQIHFMYKPVALPAETC